MEWNANLGYIVGLLATDGSLSKDGRHIDLTSKDLEQIKNLINILKIHKNKIGIKKSSYNSKGIYYRVQFSSVGLYRSLLEIGLTPNKTKTIGKLNIPKEYFSDFLRGHLDGDGCTYAYWDKRWRNSFMFYTVFMSASKKHLDWIKREISRLYGINGKISFHNKSYFHLRFAKKDSVRLLKIIYYSKSIPHLSRKRFKIEKALDIISKHAEVEKLVDSLA